MLRDAFSKEGFLVKQYLCTDAPYSGKTVAYGGCGAIACYNLMKILGRPVPWEIVKKSLERSAVLGGVLGTGVWGIFRWLKAHNIEYSFRVCSDKTVTLAHSAGIVLYPIKKGLGMHYVAFSADGEKAHFYNVSGNSPETVETLEDFLKNRSKISLAYLISVRKGLQ